MDYNGARRQRTADQPEPYGIITLLDRVRERQQIDICEI